MKWTPKTEFKTDQDGRNWRRKTRDTGWELLEDIRPSAQPLPSRPNSTELRLLVVRENQAEGEPKHWYLCLCRDDDFCVRTFQVTGDATHMVLKTEVNIDRLHAPDYLTSYELKAGLLQEHVSLIESIVVSEPAPEAPNRRSVKENCQGWTLRVLARLADKDLVEAKDIDWLRKDWLEPV